MALAQGVVDGLIGGLFMSAEIGKLKELAWEVENRRVGVMGDREGDRDGDGDGDGDGRKEGGVEG